MTRLSAVRDLTHKQPPGGGGMDHRILMLCGHKPGSKAGAVHWHGIWLRCGACQAERVKTKEAA